MNEQEAQANPEEQKVPETPLNDQPSSDFIDPSEMPTPPDDAPQAEGNGEGAGPQVDGTASMDSFEGVQEMGQVIPQGTYHFRLQSVSEGWGKADRNNPGLSYGDGSAVEDQPYFNLNWV